MDAPKGVTLEKLLAEGRNGPRALKGCISQLTEIRVRSRFSIYSFPLALVFAAACPCPQRAGSQFSHDDDRAPNPSAARLMNRAGAQPSIDDECSAPNKAAAPASSHLPLGVLPLLARPMNALAASWLSTLSRWLSPSIGCGALLVIVLGGATSFAAEAAAAHVEADWTRWGSPLLQRYPIQRTGVGGRPRVIAQLPDRRLAVGTDRGLFLYDGHRWDDLRGHSGISSIATAPDGRGFVGTGSEVHELTPDGRGGYTSRPVSRGLLRGRPDSIVSSLTYVDGRIYALDGVQLLILPIDGSEPTRIELPTWCGAGFALGNAFYVRTAEPYGPIRQFDRATGTFRAAEELFSPAPGQVFVGHTTDQNGRLWLLSESGTIYHTDGRTHTIFPGQLPPAERPLQIQAMQALPGGGLAVATVDRGFMVFDQQGRLDEITSSASAPMPSRVYTMALDDAGGLWLGSALEITRVDPRSAATVFSEAHGLRGEVWAIEKYQGGLYVATDSGLFRQNRHATGRAQAFVQLPELPPVRSLLRTPGGLWVGTRHVMLLREDGTWQDFGPATADPNPLVSWRARPDHVIAGVRHGVRVFRRQNDVWSDSGSVPGITQQVFTLAQTLSGDLWVSFGTGAIARVRWQSGEWQIKRFGEAEGIPNRWVHLGTRGDDVFVGSVDGTLRWNESAQRFEPSRDLIYYGSDDPFGFDPVFSGESETWIWPQTTVGNLTKRPRTDAIAAIALATGHSRARSRALYQDDDGATWIGLPAGLLRDVPSPTAVQPPPQVVLRRVTNLATGQALLGGVGGEHVLKLGPGRASLRVEAALTGFRADEFQQFRLHLLGREEQPGMSRNATRDFTNLAPGRHTLLIEARDGGGRRVEPVRLTLDVRKPAYATGWAYTAYAVLGGALILGFVRRRTERYHLEARRLQEAVAERTAQIQHQSTLLAEEKKLFASLAAAAPVGIWHGEAQGRVNFVNTALATLCGRAPEELERDGWIACVHPDDRDQAERLTRECLVVGSARSAELRVVRPNGDLRWVIVGVAPVSGEADRQGLVGTALDVTERREVERRMMRAQRLESIGTLTGGIAHDLNNALVPIIAGASLLDGETNPERRAVLADIERSAKRAAGMVRQLLAFARGMDGQRVPVDLTAILQELGRIITRTFPKNIRLEEEHGEVGAYVLGDPTQLHQVLLNLCVNARDAMPQGGVLSLRLESRRIRRVKDAFNEVIPAGEYRILTVGDTGSGIAPDVLEQIFDPFFTTKEPDRGTGLGLSTTLGILRGHGGHIAVETTVGVGTQFSVYLPATEAPTTPVGVPAEAAPAPLPAGTTVLVVDDEMVVRSVVTRSLQRLHLSCLEAGDGAQGLDVFKQRQADIGLLLVDVSMPVMDGITLLKHLRPHAPDLPVIAFSGNLTDEHRRELHALSVRRILSKPFRLEELNAAVRDALH